MFIDRLVRLLLPRQDIFFTLLEEIAAKMAAAAVIFGELSLATKREQLTGIAERLKLVETEADDLCHRIYEALDRTFVTPIDREDIAHLTKALDNVIDAMEHTTAFVVLFRFQTLPEAMRKLVHITTQSTTELVRAVGCLRKFGDAESIHGPTVAVHQLENDADAVYRAAIEQLFTDGTEAKDLVRQKDMLFSLEKGIDRCEDAMDVIRSVIVKNG
jgi:uncharacterized protein Yka (UPF0111/DUF47 family)